jgi:gas vesicle protein
MAFDLISFFAGIIAGGLAGALAAVLYGFERTADLQESLLKLKREVAIMEPKPTSGQENTDKGIEDLRAELDSIQDEIRKMYRKTSS